MENEVLEAQKEAETNLKNLVSKNSLRYSFMLHEEMKKILKNKGIDWEYNEGVTTKSVD